MTEMDKKIYAIGGFDGVPLNDVEVYSDTTRRWTEIVRCMWNEHRQELRMMQVSICVTIVTRPVSKTDRVVCVARWLGRWTCDQ